MFKNRFLFLFFILILTQLCLAESEHNRVVYLMSKQDSMPIANANILNLSQNGGVGSEENGSFKIISNRIDSLIISAIGYETMIIISDSIKDTLYLNRRVYNLEEFNVLPYRTFEEFKDAFVNLDIKDTTRKINISFQVSSETLRRWSRRHSPEGGFGIRIPIGRAGNKSEQWRKSLEKMEKEDKILADKFSADLIKRITGLNESAVILDFIEYCDYSKVYLTRNSKYEIIDRTFACYEEYKTYVLR